MRQIWVAGRLSWWLVGFVVLVAALWFGVDLAWRLLHAPIERFLGIALPTCAVAVLAYLWVWRRHG